MAYSVSNPPKALVKRIKKRHPKAEKKEIKQFVHVFNGALADGDGESSAYAKAWGVLNNNKKLKSSHHDTDPAKTKKDSKKQDKKANEKMNKAKLKSEGFIQRNSDKPGLWEHPVTGEQWAWSYESEFFYPVKKKSSYDKLVALSDTLVSLGQKDAGHIVREIAYQTFLPADENA